MTTSISLQTCLCIIQEAHKFVKLFFIFSELFQQDKKFISVGSVDGCLSCAAFQRQRSLFYHFAQKLSTTFLNFFSIFLNFFPSFCFFSKRGWGKSRTSFPHPRPCLFLLSLVHFPDALSQLQHHRRRHGDLIQSHIQKFLRQLLIG